MSDQTLPSAVEAIGNTPLVELARIGAKAGGRILAKLEYLNPGFSKKDRIARQIVEDAEADGTLKPGQTVIELTSGNTGTGLAIVCSVKGYPFVAVMSKGNSVERARMMRALGAEVVLVDQCEGSTPGQVSGADLEKVGEVTSRLVVERQAFRADQFHHHGNFRAHYLHTGPEILKQCQGKLDAFCDFAGSGGTFAGCAQAFKEHNPNIHCILVEPEGAAPISGGVVTQPDHPIQGGGYSMAELPMIKREHIDAFTQVSSEECYVANRRLRREEGIFAGFSSGANLAAALKWLASNPGKTIVITINDSGLKYLSTDLFDAE